MTSVALRSKRSRSKVSLANVFISRKPEMLSVSCVIALRSASLTCASFCRSYLRKPTRLDEATAKGSTLRDSSASRQSIANITATAETRMKACMRLCIIVWVMTRLMLVTSLLSRLITSPVLAAVKKRRDRDWRWA